MPTGLNSAPSASAWLGWRSASSAARSGCDSTAHTAHTPATTASVPCQPSHSDSPGTSAPASMPPAGTPVCLIENTSAMRCAGVVSASRCELAGVIGP